ncbi:polysaccharide deacetylase family protein [Ferruginibacter sp.]
MDPDAEAEQAASQILRTTFITVVFTACNYYKTETTASVSTIQFSLPDSTNKTQVVTTSLPKKKSKTIYLTFDDGPNKGTRKMMHIVEEEQVPVTLFIVGQHVYGSKEQTATFDSLVACRYFEIANHSFTHAFENKFAKFYTVPDSALKDFVRCADSLHLTANIIRTPGRNIWRTANITSTDITQSKPAADSLHKAGFTEVGWDLEWHYNPSLTLMNNSDEMLQQVDSMFTHAKTKTPGHLVILAHDQVYADATDSCELHEFIKKLKAKNEYNFEMVSKYPGLKTE